MDTFTEFDTIVDFQLQSDYGGLRMGLCPGQYEGKESFLKCININEPAFGPLEQIIVKHCPRYANYGHYGLTAIERSAWISIMEDWGKLRDHLANGGMPDEIALRWFTDMEGIKCTERALRTNIAGLIGLIDELSEWLRNVLTSEEQVCILGI